MWNTESVGSIVFELKKIVMTVAQAMWEIGELCKVCAAAIVQKAQAKEQEDHKQRHKSPHSDEPGDLALMKHFKLADRKGGKA